MRYLIILLFSFKLLLSCNYKTYIPKNAYKYLSILEEEILKLKSKNIEDINDLIYFYYFPALIEHESCVKICGNSYWAKRCWNPKSRLKTKREEGAGLFQITRVFRKDGRVKWDTLRTLKRKFPKYLKELNWDNIYDRPDLQIRAGLLLWFNNEKFFYNIPIKDRIWFVDSSYNGGFKYLNYERKKCKLIKNCNPKKWFNNVELVKSKRARMKLYGNRTAWDINRHHVKDVKVRTEKYKKYLMLN